MLNKKAIEEYKQIYKAEFGIYLNDIDALEKSSRLLNLFQTLFASNSKELDLVGVKRHHK